MSSRTAPPPKGVANSGDRRHCLLPHFPHSAADAWRPGDLGNFSAMPSLSARRRISAHTSSGPADAAFVPQHDQVVDQIGALADDAARAVAHRFESDLAGLLDQFLCDLAPTRGEQMRSARIVSFAHTVEGVV